MVELKIKLDKGATMPFKANPTDSGYDLVATRVEYNDEYGYIEYGTGVYLDIPTGYEVLIYPRSSISKYDLVQCNSVGVVDQTYNKELIIRFKPTIDYDFAVLLPSHGSLKCGKESDKGYVPFYANIYKVGDKIGQMIMQKKLDYTLKQTEEIVDSGRGCFGSSDAKYNMDYITKPIWKTIKELGDSKEGHSIE